MHTEKLVVSYILKFVIIYILIYNKYLTQKYLESNFNVSTNGDEEEARRFDSNKNQVADTNSDEVSKNFIH